jgi:N-acetylmuramoyl-L-alanine amidase
VQPQNERVSDLSITFARRLGGGIWGLGLAAVVLAGCATSEPEANQRVPDGPREEVAPAPTPAALPPEPPEPVPTPVPLAPQALPTEPAATWVPLSRWCKAQGVTGLRQIAVSPSPTYALNTPGGGLVLRVGSGVAHWDGVEVRLGFAPQMMNGQPCLHALDLSKTLEPMVSETFLNFLKPNPIIVIDAGHGGGDSGTKSVLGYGYEKDYTLDWARRLGALLATNKWRVFLTRDADVDLSLPNRIAFADAHQADVFISLHFNSAAPDQRQAGLETYCLTPTGMGSSHTRGFDDNPALDFPNNAFDEQNLQLALLVQRSLLQANGHLDRGVRRARYLGVVRAQNCAAILVEGGYLSNPHEARAIASPLYRQRLAEAVARAIALK